MEPSSQVMSAMKPTRRRFVLRGEGVKMSCRPPPGPFHTAGGAHLRDQAQTLCTVAGPVLKTEVLSGAALAGPKLDLPQRTNSK